MTFRYLVSLIINYDKSKGKIMTRQAQDSNQSKILVVDFDEEDWNELMLTDLWEPFEDGKAFLRVN